MIGNCPVTSMEYGHSTQCAASCFVNRLRKQPKIPRARKPGIIYNPAPKRQYPVYVNDMKVFLADYDPRNVKTEASVSQTPDNWDYRGYIERWMSDVEPPIATVEI